MKREDYGLQFWGEVVLGLFPLVMYLMGNIDAKQAFVIYILESLIIGIINIIRLVTTTFFKKRDDWSGGNNPPIMVTGWLFVFFFMAHYAFFVFVQMALFNGITGISKSSAMIADMLQALGNEGRLYLMLSAAGMFLLAASQFIREQEYKSKSMSQMMFEPYMRIFVQQFVVILGSLFLKFNLGLIFMLIFVGTKLFFTVFIDFGRFLKETRPGTNNDGNLN